MVGGVVIAGIVILCVLAAIELVHIFLVPEKPGRELRAFTVLVYERDDENFEKSLRGFLSELRWMECSFPDKIYVVHEDVPETKSEAVRQICSQRQELVYCSAEEFVQTLFPDKKSL